MSYKLGSATTIIRLSDGAVIPIDAGNSDYVMYQQWVAAGNTAQPADPPVPPSPLEQIRALEAANADKQVRMTRVALIDLAQKEALSILVAQAQANGATPAQIAAITPEVVHAQLMLLGKGYKDMYNLEQQIAALRELL